MTNEGRNYSVVRAETLQLDGRLGLPHLSQSDLHNHSGERQLRALKWFEVHELGLRSWGLPAHHADA